MLKKNVLRYRRLRMTFIMLGRWCCYRHWHPLHVHSLVHMTVPRTLRGFFNIRSTQERSNSDVFISLRPCYLSTHAVRFETRRAFYNERFDWLPGFKAARRLISGASNQKSAP